MTRAARDPLTRVSARPLPAQWGDDEDMTLAEAVAVFFPGGLFSVHALRTEAMHGRLTWLMQAGVNIWEAAGYAGMSAEMLERVYGHHSADFQSTAASALSGPRR